jgi:hypothetical protein
MLVGDLATTGDSGASGDAAGVDVQAGAARIQDFHDMPP